MLKEGRSEVERGRDGELTILGQATPAMKPITVLANNTFQQSFLEDGTLK